jgi:hypothetical protein
MPVIALIRSMSTYIRPGKTQYTEAEVAGELGLSVDVLRALIKERIMGKDDEVQQAAEVTYQPSDLLLLRLMTATLQAEQAEA